MKQWEKKFGRDTEEFEFVKKTKALDIAAKTATNQEDFDATVEKLTGEPSGVKFMGDKIEQRVRGKDGKWYILKGKRQAVTETWSAMAEDPSWGLVPEKAQKTGAWMAKQGVTFELAEEERKKQSQIEKEDRAEAVTIRKENRKKEEESLKSPTIAERQAVLLDDIGAGRPLSDLSETDRALVDKATGGKTKGVKDQALSEWQQANPGKSIVEFQKEWQSIPTRQINIEGPRLKYEDQIENQTGFMADEARELVDKDIKSNPRLKVDIGSGKVSADNLAVEKMARWVQEKYKDAVLYEQDGEYMWALPDGKIVAGKNGWVD
jgi:hypothetical protein